MNDSTHRTLQEVAGAFRDAPGVANKAASMALNDAARKGRTLGSRHIREQVNLTASYINRHLKVGRKASPDRLEASIAAHRRSVLLTRYGAEMRLVKASSDPSRLKGDPARGIPRGYKAGGAQGVSIKRGGSSATLRHAFWIRLQGSGKWAPMERTGPGRGDFEPMYGPSVDQVWQDVRGEVEPDVSELALTEFTRQFARLA